MEPEVWLRRRINRHTLELIKQIEADGIPFDRMVELYVENCHTTLSMSREELQKYEMEGRGWRRD